MKRKLLVIACLAAAFALMTGAILAQDSDSEEPADTDTEAQSDLGVVFLDEVGGFDGMAILHGDGDGSTEVSMGLRSAGGFLGMGRGDPETLGQVAILRGTCGEPESVVEEIGELAPALLAGQRDDDGPEAFALTGSIGMGLEELRAGAYVLGVLEREREDEADDQDGQQQEGEQQEEEINLAACGTLGQEPDDEAGTGDDRETPDAGPSPTPGESTPTPTPGQ